MWILFTVPCPTPDGQTAEDLYRKRVDGISPAMQASARELGCVFHRAWYAAAGSAFYAMACWKTAEGANEFFRQWDIADEPGRWPSVWRATSGSFRNREPRRPDLTAGERAHGRGGGTVGADAAGIFRFRRSDFVRSREGPLPLPESRALSVRPRSDRPGGDADA
jgi:hypothetical protein